jgi:hypothetical protein
MRFPGELITRPTSSPIRGLISIIDYTERREEFLSSYPPDSLARPFYESAFRLLEALSPPITYHHGLACIQMLYMTIITMVDEATIGNDPIMGSIEDCASVVAVMFATIQQDPIWWKASFPGDGYSQEVNLLTQQLIQQLRQLDLVVNVLEFEC